MTARLKGAVRGWPLGLFLLAVLGLFWRLWWPDATSWAFAYGDFTEQYYPMRAFVAAQWHMLQIPLWDPFTFSGEPAAGASLFAPFYPIGLWQALFPPPLPFPALEFDALFHLALGGWFTYLFLRQRTQDLWAGLLAGTAFALGGYLTSYPVLQLGILYTAVWLPLVLYLIERGLTRNRLSSMLLPGLALGVSILAGHPQTFLYIAYVVFPYLILRTRQEAWSWSRSLAAALVVGLTAMGAGAAHWLPGLELLRLSPRVHLTYGQVAHGFTWADFWGLVRPNANAWSPLYVGLLALILALASPMLARRHRGEILFWMVLALLALLLSLGKNGFLYPFFYRWVPGFALFRNQERAAFLVSFALAVLAGYGFAGLRQKLTTRISSPRNLTILSLALLGLLGVDLFHANQNLILAPAPAQGYFPQNPITDHIRATSLPDWRMSSEGLLPGDGNAALVYRLRDVVGNSPLHLAAYDTFIDTVPEIRWLSLLNVHYLITTRSLEHGAVQPILQQGDQHLYQVHLGATPVWITHAYQVVPDQQAAIQATADMNLAPKQTAILESPPSLDIRPPDPQAHETVQLTHFQPHFLEAQAHLASPALLIFSEIDYPGWQVWINGQRVPALRAYGLLRAVAAPAGDLTIQWRYRPFPAWAGIAISLITLLLTALVMYRRTARPR